MSKKIADARRLCQKHSLLDILPLRLAPVISGVTGAHALHAKGVGYSLVAEEDRGIKTSLLLPSGSEIGLYQPTHTMAPGLH
jgi:hypothetical protein